MKQSDIGQYELDCRLGKPNACENAGYKYLRGDGVNSSSIKAFEYLKQACVMDTGRCVMIGNGFRDSNNREYTKAIEFYSQACKANDTEGCFELGEINTRIGKDSLRDNNERKDAILKAAEAYNRACNGGSARGCSELGETHIFIVQKTNYAGKESILKALEGYSRACDGGIVEGCRGSSEIYEYGYGVKQSDSKAMEYLKKACDFGDERFCNAFIDYQLRLKQR